MPIVKCKWGDNERHDLLKNLNYVATSEYEQCLKPTIYNLCTLDGVETHD